MGRDVIIGALQRAGATFENSGETYVPPKSISKADMYLDGLSGREGSAGRRRVLMKKFDLPEHLSADALLDVLNALYTYDEYKNAVSKLE
jgi:ribonuclease M5